MPPTPHDPNPAPQPPSPPTEVSRPRRPASDIVSRLASRRDATPGAGSEPGTPSTPRYRLDGEIARGGMGAIMKVWDTDLRRALAMKVILGGAEPAPDGSTPDMRLDRFLEEAQITGQLDHPGVVPVHELGVDGDGRAYFTMRLVRGREFSTVIALARDGREGWTRTRALDALLRVCETMAYAHAKSVVHRDLKPENVMVGQFGETYVMDWGLARVLGQPDTEAQRKRILGVSSVSVVHIARRDGDSDGSAMTEEGAIMGTPFYMPPEQAAGELENIGPQSDVYAAGAMLYHLLTGKRPYDELRGQSSLAVVRAVLAGPPIDLHQLDKTIPPELGAICQRAMARAVTDRYPDMIEMAADLRAFLESRVVKAYKTGALVEFRKWITRNRAASAALAALLVVALVGLAAFGWQQREKAAAIATQQQLTQDARDSALRNLALARQQAYVANVTAANASLAAGEILEAKRHLAECTPELRGFEWRHLSLRADSSLFAFPGHTAAVTDLAFDPRGTRVVSGADDGTVRIWDLPTRTAAHVLDTDSGESGGGGGAVAFLADGAQVASFGRRRNARIQTWNASTGDLASRLPLESTAVYALAIAPDGARAALGAPDSTIHIVDARSGAVTGRLVGHGATVRALAFAADGRLLASGSEDRTVRVWSLDAARLLATSQPCAHTVHATAFAPDGTEVVAGLEDGTILRLLAADGSQRGRMAGHSGAVYALAYGASGRRLASASFDKTVRQWDPARDEPIAVLLGHDHPVRSVAWSADGTRIASGSEDATIRIWDASRPGAIVVHAGADEDLTAVAFPGGDRIVVGGSWPGTIELVAASTGATIAKVEGPQDTVAALASAPQGDGFAVGYKDECSVRVFDPATGALGEPCLGHEASVTAIAYRRDGKRLASASDDKTVRIWDIATRTMVGMPLPHAAPVSHVAFARDDNRLATCARDGSARVFDADTGAVLTTIAGRGIPLRALAFSPDGTRLALGDAQGRVHLVDAGSGAEITTLVGHDQEITALAFAPDGTRLATGADDATVRVWDVAAGRLLLTLRGHRAPVTGVAFSGDGDRLASTSQDNSLRVWRAGPSSSGPSSSGPSSSGPLGATK